MKSLLKYSHLKVFCNMMMQKVRIAQTNFALISHIVQYSRGAKTRGERGWLALSYYTDAAWARYISLRKNFASKLSGAIRLTNKQRSSFSLTQ